MATHSTRSVSLSPPATPENRSSMRRSFIANNRPWVSGRRSVDNCSAISVASYVRNYDEKENDERDNSMKSCKMDSPAKNCKHFMSPTISAASKFTSSPRKKVFAERNESIRTSLSLSDGKVAVFSSKSQDKDRKSGLQNPRNSDPECFLDSVSGAKNKSSKKVLFSEPDSLSSDHLTLKQELAFMPKNSCSPVSSSIVAPLDADPSLQPYDPKINYLSPRPQFLYYRPNTRTDVLLNRERVLDPEFEGELMAEMMSESFSDSSGSDESHVDYSKKDEFPVVTPYDMVIGMEELELYPPASENCCTDDETATKKETIISEEETESEDHISEAFEPLGNRETPKNAVSETSPDMKTQKKVWGFLKLMCFGLFLGLLLACTSIFLIHSPSVEKVVTEEFSLSNIRVLYQQSLIAAKKEFHLLSSHANHLSHSLVSYVYQLVDELGNGGKGVQIQYMNISNLQEVTWNQENLMNIDFNIEALDDAFEEATWYEASDFEEEYDQLVLEETATPDLEDALEEVAELEEKLEEEGPRELVGETEVVMSGGELQIVLKTEVVTPMELEPEPKHNHEREHEAASEDAYDVKQKTEKSSDEEHSQEISLYQLASSMPMAHESTDQVVSEVAQSPALDSHHSTAGISTDTKISLEPEPSLQQNYHTMEVTLIILVASASLMGVSFFMHQRKKLPSSSRTSLKNDTENEVESWERRAKRHSQSESLASSSGFSSDSQSYGSFTTLERIPLRSGNGEEKILTPVRRSNRIRTITSSQ